MKYSTRIKPISYLKANAAEIGAHHGRRTQSAGHHPER